ncbi:thiamine-monophosphate kinase [Microlunatus phosphovorus NM-1]|uniref:Thiamine-monophosphate kinase n=1 Tax=Microlunatus phosphovorus (strain ATCC 700054 / DSM 10555 / JCM 9379 / NBRC 101784 / NCIMB 13414 / VKM Ac-1990 / NM-1) TaxID=1032480 RepID=F5XDU5_MICPN|nr:thiamine-monophosphate kinase [Microlunatus phosphovorus NM-1]
MPIGPNSAGSLPTGPARSGTGRSGPTLGESGEFALIARIVADLPPSAEVVLGPGDDAAALAIEPPVLTSVDVLVEGVHFRRDWSSAADVGRKAVAVNVADIEAMGGRAVAVVVGLSAPADLPLAWALELADGIRSEGERAGVTLVGGDVTGARDVTISVTVLGGLDGGPLIRRSGAGSDQVVALTGRTGWAAAGMAVLQRGFRSPRAVVEAQRVPEVPYGQGRVAAEAGATAMIDVSDGLLADLGHVARASGVMVELDLSAFPVPDVLRAVAAATGKDPYALLLTGGEDHALAACFSSADQVPDGWRVVGRTRQIGEDEEPGVLVDGAPWKGAAGWDHFGGGR